MYRKEGFSPLETAVIILGMDVFLDQSGYPEYLAKE
jgi:hypothetical protein